MNSISKSLYADKLDDIINENNNTYRKAIKMESIDTEDSTYINLGKENNNKDLKFQVEDHVRISKYKNVFAKGYTPNWSDKVFEIKKVKNKRHGHMLLMILMVKKLWESFMKKNCRRLTKKILDKKSNSGKKKQTICQMERI